MTVTPSVSSCKAVTCQPNRIVMLGRVRACASKNASTYIWLARKSGSGVWSVAAEARTARRLSASDGMRMRPSSQPVRLV